MVQESKHANSYVDADRIRRHEGYIYIWELLDIERPNEHGISSILAYTRCDCDLFRYGPLSFSLHKEAMGEGHGKSVNVEEHEWTYPKPESRGETFLNIVCMIANDRQIPTKLP